MNKIKPIFVTILCFFLLASFSFTDKRASKNISKKKTKEKTTVEQKLFKPYVVFSGITNWNSTRKVIKIKEKNEWAKLWLKIHNIETEQNEYDYYYNVASVPEIDFENCMAIAIFEQKGKIITPPYPFGGFIIKEILEDNENFKVRLEQKSFDIVQYSDTATTTAIIPSKTIFTIIIMPKTTKKIILEVGAKSSSSSDSLRWINYSSSD